MIIEYCDKDGKRHKIKLSSVVTLHFPKGNTGEFTSLEVKETKQFNPATNQFEPAGVARVSPTHGGDLITCARDHQLLIAIENETFKCI